MVDQTGDDAVPETVEVLVDRVLAERVAELERRLAGAESRAAKYRSERDHWRSRWETEDRRVDVVREAVSRLRPLARQAVADGDDTDLRSAIDTIGRDLLSTTWNPCPPAETADEQRQPAGTDTC